MGNLNTSLCSSACRFLPPPPPRRCAALVLAGLHAGTPSSCGSGCAGPALKVRCWEGALGGNAAAALHGVQPNGTRHYSSNRQSRVCGQVWERGSPGSDPKDGGS